MNTLLDIIKTTREYVKVRRRCFLGKVGGRKKGRVENKRIREATVRRQGFLGGVGKRKAGRMEYEGRGEDAMKRQMLVNMAGEES